MTPTRKAELRAQRPASPAAPPAPPRVATTGYPPASGTGTLVVPSVWCPPGGLLTVSVAAFGHDAAPAVTCGTATMERVAHAVTPGGSLSVFQFRGPAWGDVSVRAEGVSLACLVEVAEVE